MSRRHDLATLPLGYSRTWAEVFAPTILLILDQTAQLPDRDAARRRRFFLARPHCGARRHPYRVWRREIRRWLTEEAVAEGRLVLAGDPDAERRGQMRLPKEVYGD